MNIDAHRKVIDETLSAINSIKHNPYVLKGGTALMTCYGLDRFSEDIDLDAPAGTAFHGGLYEALESLCEIKGYNLRKAKNTETVQRVFIHYGSDKPLKVEVSYRRKTIDNTLVTNVGGIQVYTIDQLCMLKCSAYLSRDKIRDLYDVTYICTRFKDDLSPASLNELQNVFEYKDLDQFDYLVRTQDDPLIDVDKMETAFLESYEILGLSTPTQTLSLEERAHGDDENPSR